MTRRNVGEFSCQSGMIKINKFILSSKCRKMIHDFFVIKFHIKILLTKLNFVLLITEDYASEQSFFQLNVNVKLMATWELVSAEENCFTLWHLIQTQIKIALKEVNWIMIFMDFPSRCFTSLYSNTSNSRVGFQAVLASTCLLSIFINFQLISINLFYASHH